MGHGEERMLEGAIKLYEPFSLTFLLIAVLNLAVGGSLFGWFYADARAICYEQNAQLVTEGKHGPPKACLS